MYFKTGTGTQSSVKKRHKWWIDKCPSIILLGQTISDLLRHILGEIHMCHSRCATVDVHSRCATVDVPQQMCHSRCATVDVPQQMCHSRCATADVHISTSNESISRHSQYK